MSNYNLSEGLEDHFTFEVTLDNKTHSYSMKYPSTKQLLTIRGYYDQLEEIGKKIEEAEDNAKKNELTAEANEIGKRLSDAFTGMFTVSEGSMPIDELLDILPTNMRAKFDDMIKKEIGGEAK